MTRVHIVFVSCDFEWSIVSVLSQALDFVECDKVIYKLLENCLYVFCTMYHILQAS